MIKSRKLQITLILTLACICTPILGSEPNETKTELKFEIKSTQQARMLLRAQSKPPYGSTHYAVLFIRGDWSHYRNRTPIEAILETSLGRAMSQQQRDVISNQLINFRDYNTTISNYTYFQLFAVSEEDVKKMVNAFIEVLVNKTNKEMQHFLSQQQKYQKEIDEIKKKLPEKQKQYDEAKSKYNEIKDARYFSLGGLEVYIKAKDTMLQMVKTLDTLEIELAGIQEKLNSIEKYRRRKYAEDAKNFSPETLDKIDQMFIEQMIELSGVKARQHAALKIREREKEFLVLFNQQSNLEDEVNNLKNSLKISENNLRSAEKILDNPVPEMLPPKVFQNKVTIYPVK